MRTMDTKHGEIARYRIVESGHRPGEVVHCTCDVLVTYIGYNRSRKSWWRRSRDADTS